MDGKVGSVCYMINDGYAAVLLVIKYHCIFYQEDQISLDM
jgi:hypothetical protein